jgi:sugar lactone lactonase YvrE
MKNIFITFAAIILLASALCAQWTDNQAAEFVIGQSDFTTNTPACTATGLDCPLAIAIDFQHSKMYIADEFNCRVLRYAYPLTGNTPTAELVFGQPDFTSDAVHDWFNTYGWWPAPTAKQILLPIAIAVYNGDLWVADDGNSRVVRFSQAYNQTVNNADADLVLGQTNFITRDQGCTSSSFLEANGLMFDGNGNLWVADGGNCRILRFNNASSLANGSSANGVLGQPDFTTGTMTTSPAQNKIGLPSSLCFDGTTLWVCDKQFNRVLRFDSAATKLNGANADGVLGQSNFTGSAAGTTPSTFDNPYGVCADAKGNLYVSEQTNNRVPIFLNAESKSNGANADNLLGQSSFYSITQSAGNNSFYHGTSNFAVDNTAGKLLIADRSGCRVMQFAASGSLTGIKHNETSSFSGVPKQFRLSNYPNPFNPSTTISIFVPFRSSVVVEVCDVLGRRIKTLMHKDLSQGRYNVPFDGTSLTSGVYFCRLKAEGFEQTQKLLLVK